MVLGLKTRDKKSAESRMVKIFGALGDATRYKLIQLLSRKEELCVSELAEEIGISTAGASQHLKILEQAGLVDRNRMGQKICYVINKDTRENKRLFEMMNS